MIDKDLFARAIGVIKNNPSTTVLQLCIDLDIDYYEAEDVLNQYDRSSLYLVFLYYLVFQ